MRSGLWMYVAVPLGIFLALVTLPVTLPIYAVARIFHHIKQRERRHA